MRQKETCVFAKTEAKGKGCFALKEWICDETFCPFYKSEADYKIVWPGYAVPKNHMETRNADTDEGSGL